MSERVLVVEDEKSLQETLAYNLHRQGYEVEIAGDGNDAVALALDHRPDLILLDIMLPGLDGFEVCRILRQEMSVPIIFLTARDDGIDRAVGLEIGGDDYVSKPFSMRELVARVKVRLRTSRVLREEVVSQAAQGQDGAQTFGSLAITRNYAKFW
jgi:DNA-binding response OmpR family regulator